LFIRSELRAQVENRVRRYFDEQIENGRAGLITWMFAIRSEIARAGSAHRIRGLFERAAENLQTRDAIVLWRFYLDFEISTSNENGAKRAYFRAVRRVPWSKLLWTDCVSKLRAFYTNEELEELLHLMAEKEIRIRTDPREATLKPSSTRPS